MVVLCEEELIRFASLEYLLLVLPLGASLYLGHRMIRGMAKRRKSVALILRGLIYILLVLSVMGPVLYRPNQGACTVFLVDRSDSITDRDRQRQDEFIERAIATMPDGDQAAIVAFGANAVIESAPAGRRQLRRIESKVEATNSNLAGALRLASAIFPPGKARRAVVLSDGNETQGELKAAATTAKSDTIELDFVALGGDKTGAEALISSLELPDSGKADQPFDLKVQIESKGISSGTLIIDRDGTIIDRRQVSLHDGHNTLMVKQTVKDVGLVRYRATLQANGDTDPRNNVGAGFINVRGRPKLLLVQANAKDKSLFDALLKGGLNVDLVFPGSLPSRREQLQAYDSILLNDINATLIPPTTQEAIVSAARDSGVGLAMIGGEDSFLPGGWYGTAITEALPVDLNIRQKKSLAAASVLIIADCSGSMGQEEDGVTKIKLASRAAEETIKMLGPMDRIAVAGSSDGIEIVAPMQSAANKEAAINGARKLAVTGGGIYIRPSILKAEEILKSEPSKTRHFILLADGADSTDWEGALQTAARMRAQKITTSVVAIGDGKDVPDLRKLAAIGGGRFYLALKANQLPAIFTQDTSVMSRSAIEEGAFVPKVTQLDDSIRGVFDGGAPPLLAYCLTEPKPLAKVILKSKKDDPLLLHGRAGLAQTMAFTSDAKARWARSWIGWDGFATFWSQQVRAIGRQSPENNYQVSIVEAGGKSKVSIVGRDKAGNLLDAPSTPVRISSPDGKSKELVLLQTAPGTYEGEFDVTAMGSYIVSVVEPDGKGGNKIQTAGVSVAYPPEYRVLRTNRALLSEAAKLTGGRELVKPEDVHAKNAIPGQSLTEMWSTFLLAALLLLPFDIANRRLSVSIWQLFNRRPKASTTPEVTRLQTLKTIKKVKQRPAQTPAAPMQISRPEPIQPEPEPAESQPNPESAGSALLEARRKRDRSE